MSLREVNAAAGQRNKQALHRYFGGREGMLQAMTARHLPRIAAHQQALLDEATSENRLDDVRTLVSVIVRPSAEYIAAGPQERAWLSIAMDLGTRPQTSADEIAAASSTAAWTAGERLVRHLTNECGLPQDFAVRRVWTAMEIVMYTVGARARLEDASGARRLAAPLGFFVEELLDMICAALVAPVSDAARVAFEHDRCHR